MKIKTYYKSGLVKVENVKKSYDFYELDDGYHIIPPDSVYRDRAGDKPAMVIMVDGLIAPLGSKQTVELVDKVWNNMDLSKDANNLPPVSTSLMRMLSEFLGKFVKYVPILVIVILIIYALVSTQGGPKP